MARWVCPRCDREFDRVRQSHICVPAGTVDDTFAGKPDAVRAAYDVIIAHLRALGPVHEDAVKVGVFLKHDRKFAELRPTADRSASDSRCLVRSTTRTCGVPTRPAEGGTGT